MLLVTCLYANILFGQNVFHITGKVLDETNSSLPGVNIYIPELQVGIATDINGDYELTGLRAGNYTIQYFYIGYKLHYR